MEMSELLWEKSRKKSQRAGSELYEEGASEKLKLAAHCELACTPTARTNEPSSRLLPPIVSEGDIAIFNISSVPNKSLKSPLVEKLWSPYHKDCFKRDSAYMDWSGAKSKRVPGQTRRAKNGEVLEIVDYLDRNRDVLESYVLNSIPLNELEEWLLKKMTRNIVNNPSSDSQMLLRHGSKGKQSRKQMFMDLVNSLQEDTDEHSILWKLVSCISSSIGVDAYRVYKIFPDHSNFVQYFGTDTTKEILNPTRLIRASPQQVVLVLEAAKKAVPWCISRADHPVTFPETPHALLKLFGTDSEKNANYILYQPILTAAGKTAYVIEMWRVETPFTDKDEDMSSSFLVWGSLALHYCSLYLDKKRERSMSDFLLDVVKAIFEEMVSLDQLIKRILEFAQRLVNADRASLFLVDYRNYELVSTVFDLKFEPGLGHDMEKKEIRMPINRGIAGHVALSGETMNIPDAYSDFRFNREVDEATGYKTISILCMPIKVQGKVIGVVQMVNKRNHDNFDHEDEVAFEIFSTFFGLALHHARLYDRIMRKEQKYRVALEVLSYHNTCRENEVQAIVSDKQQLEANVNDFYLDPYRFTEFEKCKAAITMFDDLFDLTNFDRMTVTRFVLTVKKNYRRVPYHNFDHGWCVAHAMYVMLKNDDNKRFDYKMRLAMFVACLCHDLDHRGYTNKYMSETASPLAAMYTTSTLEHHHFNITVTILQQDGHNIFSHLTSSEYKEILGFIRQCILATDLAAFFPNLEKLKEVHEGDPRHYSFNWNVPSHRDLAMAISMTAADLSASAKPWSIQIKTVKVIFEEFYDQGDKERAAGRTPIPMMDRNKPDEQPASQVGFLSQICVPCYKMLYRILPNTKPMYIMALRNLNKWKTKADHILKKIAKELEHDMNCLDVKDDVTEFDREDVNVNDTINEGLKEDPKEGASLHHREDSDYNELNINQDQRNEERKIEEISNCIEAAWKNIKLEGNWNSWEEADEGDIVEEANCSGIWKDIDGAWVDEEGVLVKPRRAIKIRTKSNNGDVD
ncbi:unnamed protein product, partial [Iphiclides podalirius]